MNGSIRSRVVVGLSGGVDSAVAALLLKQQGCKVEGLFMDNWEDGEEQTYCSAAQDFQDARQACETLG
ncbi:MAG: tRNA 2-thiouridine(34) synthase MnmA, partial [Gammaproteobacteria bacterium]|nr:tRNA 2-thiouridine(34) synthase MnmA [Gammaproteobacteria bacterium]